jgi:hypothetical protein
MIRVNFKKLLVLALRNKIKVRLRNIRLSRVLICWWKTLRITAVYFKGAAICYRPSEEPHLKTSKISFHEIPFNATDP